MPRLVIVAAPPSNVEVEFCFFSARYVGHGSHVDLATLEGHHAKTTWYLLFLTTSHELVSFRLILSRLGLSKMKPHMFKNMYLLFNWLVNSHALLPVKWPTSCITCATTNCYSSCISLTQRVLRSILPPAKAAASRLRSKCVCGPWFVWH